MAFLHFSNPRHENVAYLFLRFLFRSPRLRFLSNSLSDTQTYNPQDLLGLGDQEGVIKEEEVSLLGLQACLQLCLGVIQEQTGWTLGEEGLDEWT